MDYATNLLEVRQQYPFDNWKTYDMEQYTVENCEAAQRIFETLLSDLIALGENAAEDSKLQTFQLAVEALNTLNDETASV